MEPQKISLCLATNNQHKVEELLELLGDGFEIKTLSDIGCFDDIEETGQTFVENSKIKADYIFNKYRINVIADDSGLEVTALQNKPGVFSARYAGEPANHSNNIAKVLTELGSSENRKARFVTVITLILDGKPSFFEGEIKGTIGIEKKGIGGFGYDPIFIPDGYSETFAELSASQKNTISHRANAIAKMKEFLTKNQKKSE